MACLMRCCCCCRPCNGFIQGCTSLETITLNPPTIITSTYEDQCGCRTCCTYPNKVRAILPAQILTFIAFVFTGRSVNDCSLVQVPNTPETGLDNFTITTVFNGTIPSDIMNDYSPTRSLGIFTWESIDGSCVFEDDRGGGFSKISRYWRVLGGDFATTSKFGVATTIFGIVLGLFSLFVFLWMICILSCVAHTRRHRAVLASLLTIGLPTLQPLIFLLFRTEFCRKNSCELGDAGKSAIAAIFLYFIAGMIILFATNDFPGNPYKENEPMMRLNLPSYFSPRSNAASDSSSSNQNINNSRPTPSVELTNYSNGFADAVEIPVDGELIDRTLIESDIIDTIAP
jgi:hypothetical protein